ncbi:hypothetical protein V490_08056 [Pseudogymnoascus sp. VKM F-3557]|nr:hypothetical protein V490_08056 [Pseudogymnoascus sp. VKM F-3557]
MSTSLPQGRKPVFILSHPRTASNLFMKIFKSHPDIVQIEYPFLDSFYFGSESQCGRKSAQIEKKRAELQEQISKPKTYRGCFEKLEENICKAREQGTVAFVKEHVFTFLKPSIIDSNLETPRPPRLTPQVHLYDAETRVSSNPTLLPDDFMLSFVPVFLIRHPALVFASWYRLGQVAFQADIDDSDFPLEVTFSWSHILYDWYFNASEPLLNSPEPQLYKPAVIDADDIMSDRGTLQRLCHQLHVDPQHLVFEWQVTKTGLVPWFSSIQKSTGVDMSKLSKGLDIQREFGKWESEFGAEVAQKLLHFVELAMPDYEYLLAQRG